MFTDGIEKEDVLKVIKSVVKSNVDVEFVSHLSDSIFPQTDTIVRDQEIKVPTEEFAKDWKKFEEHLNPALVKYFTKRDKDAANVSEKTK